MRFEHWSSYSGKEKSNSTMLLFIHVLVSWLDPGMLKGIKDNLRFREWYEIWWDKVNFLNVTGKPELSLIHTWICYLLNGLMLSQLSLSIHVFICSVTNLTVIHCILVLCHIVDYIMFYMFSVTNITVVHLVLCHCGLHHHSFLGDEKNSQLISNNVYRVKLLMYNNL